MGMRQEQMDVVRVWLENSVLTSDYPTFDPDTLVLDEPVNRHRPTGPYISIQMIAYNVAMSSLGDPGYMHDEPYMDVQTTIMVRAFGEEAIEWLAQAQAQVYTPVIQDAIQTANANGNSFHMELAGGGIDIVPPTLLDIDFEVRGVITVTVGCRHIVDRVTGPVDSVAIVAMDPSLQVTDGSGTPVSTPFSADTTGS